MGEWWCKFEIVCHWCGKVYEAKKGKRQARFCSNACKMAHHRAYKKYVTSIRYRNRPAAAGGVTQKKAKKRKCDTCSAKPDGCALWKNPDVQGCKRYLKKSKKRGKKNGKVKGK